jgi:ribosome-binding protein aMBF1 (putative translation factor)
MAGHTRWSEIRAATINSPEREAGIEHERRLLDLEHRLYDARRAVGMSQAEVAAEMGVTQANVSRIERADDLQLSTLDKYVRALGGRLEFRVVFDDEEVVLGE